MTNKGDGSYKTMKGTQTQQNPSLKTKTKFFKKMFNQSGY